MTDDSQIRINELARELEERGIEGLEEADTVIDYEAPWERVEAKKPSSSKPIPKREKRAATFTFGDIRQKQYSRPAGSASPFSQKSATLAPV